MEESAAATGGWKGLPFYKRVTIVGLLVEAVLLLVIAILVAATGDPGVSVFFGIFVVPSAVIAWLLWKYDRRVLIAAVVWTILSLLAALVFLLPALAYPNSFFDFGFTVPIIVSLLLAVVGSIVSVVQRRRGRVPVAD